MYIKKLIKNKEEYWEFVWQFIEWSNNPPSLWREEDLPKLKPFFDAQNKARGTQFEWTPEIKESFDFYLKCKEEYGDKNTELRDAVSKLSPEDILEAFGYELPEPDDGYGEDEDEDDYAKDNPLELDEDFKDFATFPFVVTGEIYCGWDRAGDIKVLSIYHVSLEDFNGKA